jgi:hypothetical protein
MLLGFVWFTVVKARAPQVIAGIEHDLESGAAAVAE